MTAELYKNIELVRIPIKAGMSEYHFPQNVNWAGEKVQKIVVCAPQIACIDPLDGQTPVMSAANVDSLYFELYDSNERELVHDLNYQNISHRNNNVIELDSVLNLSLCRMYFMAAPAQDATLLLYVYHDTKTTEDYDMPTRTVSVEFPLAANQEINLQEIINTYIHALPATLKGVIFWNAETDPAYITLRDYKLTYSLNNLHSELARPMETGASAEDCQAKMMLFDNIDIDFQYSHIREAAGQSSTQKITFLY